MTFASKIEPKEIEEAIFYKHWSLSMEEEFNQFERSKIWELVLKDLANIMIETFMI